MHTHISACTLACSWMFTLCSECVCAHIVCMRACTHTQMHIVLTAIKLLSWPVDSSIFLHYVPPPQGRGTTHYAMMTVVWYGIVEFNVPLDTV